MTTKNKSWQSRLRKPQDELAIDFVESISIDARLYKYDIAGSIAHAEMLMAQSILSRSEFQQIKQALTEIAETMDQGRFRFDKKQEDIHMVIEAALINKIGDVGKKLHTGRSRNDQVILDTCLFLRDTIDQIRSDLHNLKKALIDMASSRQGRYIMPGYTHLQQAQPVLLGSYLLAWVEKFHRDEDRLSDCYKRVNVCPLGSGAIAGSTLPLDRHKVAQLLGFPEVTRNSIDSISTRDASLEFVSDSAMIAMHLSRLAEDWIIFSSQEFDFLTLDDSFCTGSSMMPQKRNPDMLELIRGKTGRVYGNLVTFLTMLKGQPLSYNRDMQEDKQPLFDTVDTVHACLQMAAAIVKTSKWNDDSLKNVLKKSFLDATVLAEYLVAIGIPFRQAHQIVGKLVADCEQQNITLAQLPIEQMKKACDLIKPDVYDHLGPENVVARYQTTGSAGYAELTTQLEYWKVWLAQR